MSKFGEVGIDTSKAFQQLRELDQAIERGGSSLNNLAMGARTTYQITTNIVRAAGGSISTIFDAVITTGLQSIQILSSIQAARAAGGPIGWIQMGLGFISLGILVSSVSAAQAKQAQTENRLRAANMGLMNVQTFIGGFHFS